MERVIKGIEKASSYMDILAGIGIVAAMAVVVLNIILRTVFNNPILGTYEYTGFLTAFTVSMGLAYCAVSNGHIAIDFILEKFSRRVQNIVDLISNIVVVIFMVFFTFRMFTYACKIMQSGEVSPTTQTPFYLFVFIMAFGFVMLCLAICTRIYKVLKGGMEK